MKNGAAFLVALACLTSSAQFAALDPANTNPPQRFAGQFGSYKSLLEFDSGAPVRTASDWNRRRQEIYHYWTNQLGPWPEILTKPRVDFVSRTNRENFVQHRVQLEISQGKLAEAYLLVPNGSGPFPAVLVPFYEPETSIGLKGQFRDFALQLTKRGFVSLSIGSPGGDARNPDMAGAKCQPLSYLAYIAANCANALASLPTVNPKKIGMVGHSYGGKWAMFAGALSTNFAAVAVSDPGIVFDESRPNVNYWEPWYLGLDPEVTRRPGLIAPGNPRTGAYKRIFESGHDLHEVIALIAPRPFLVSGGSEDPPERWHPLNRANEVYHLLGRTNHIAMTNRAQHDPSTESNEVLFRFFQHWLQR